MLTEAEIGIVVVGVTEVFKRFGLKKKYAPVFAIFLAIILTVADEFRTGGADYFKAVIRGIVVGVTTTGLYAAAGNLRETGKR